MTTTTDGEAMLQVQAGDFAQLAVLFERHHARLFNYFLRMTGSRDVSQDLVQELFVRILKYRGSYRGELFAPWMYGMARNLCRDQRRLRQRQLGRETPLEEPAAEVTPPAEALARREELALLRSALERLPQDKRELLLLARFASLEYREIAELLGCTVGAVKVRVHRALQQLRQVYLELSEATS